MATPEGKVKKQVKDVLNKYENLHAWWPVPSGYGESHLDCIVCFYGLYIAIETKAPGKPLTPLQRNKVREIIKAGGVVFIIGGPDQTRTVEEVDEFLSGLDMLMRETAPGEH